MDKPPNTIYLINEGDYYSWCEDPAPGIGMEESDAICYELSSRIAELEAKLKNEQDEIARLKTKIHDLKLYILAT